MGEDFKRKMEKRIAREQEETEKAAKLFDPSELTRSSKTLRSVYVPSLKSKVQFGALTLNDNKELDKYPDKNEKGYVILWIMLRKAYPELTLETIKEWDIVEVQEILNALTVFLIPKTSTPGSTTTTPPSGSDSSQKNSATPPRKSET
jgi:hypothetical protein